MLFKPFDLVNARPDVAFETVSFGLKLRGMRAQFLQCVALCGQLAREPVSLGTDGVALRAGLVMGFLDDCKTALGDHNVTAQLFKSCALTGGFPCQPVSLGTDGVALRAGLVMGILDYIQLPSQGGRMLSLLVQRPVSRGKIFSDPGDLDAEFIALSASEVVR